MKKIIILLLLLQLITSAVLPVMSEDTAEYTEPRKIGDYYFKYQKLTGNDIQPYEDRIENYQNPPHYIFSYNSLQVRDRILLYSSDNKSYQPLDFKSYAYPGWDYPIYGDGFYLLHTLGDIGAGPGLSRQSTLKNSPIYVFDSSMTLVDKINFSIFLSGLRYNNGYFSLYFSYPSSSPMHSTHDVSYRLKPINGVDWKVLTSNNGTDEAELINTPDGLFKDEIPEADNKMINGDSYYQTNISENSSVTSIKGINIDDSEEKLNGYKIERETNPILRSIDTVNSNDFTVIKMISNTTSYGDIRYNEYSLSLDGFTRIEVSHNIGDYAKIRNDDKYLYVTDNVLHSKCHRIPLSAFESKIKVMYDDKYLAFYTQPVIENDRTLIPLRFLFEQMGAVVSWEQTTKTATVTAENGDKIVFSIDNKSAKVNNTEKTMDVPARLINSKTMVPLRFLSEELGYKVDWEQASNTAVISTQ